MTIPASERVRRIRLQRAAVLGAFMWAASALTGCGSTRSAALNTEIIPYDQEQLQAREQAKEARYLLRTGDRFRVSFKYEPDLDVENVLVMPDGYIGLKGLTEPVHAAGQTIESLDRSLEDLYRRDYRNPDLSIQVLELASPEVYVLGWVRAPGLYKIPVHGTGVLQAVALAGGFLEDAKRSQVVLLRATDEGFLTRTYDFSHVAKDGITELSWFDLQPYDIVYVPETKLHNFAHITGMIFGTAVDITGFFWDVYALTNLDKIQTILR